MANGEGNTLRELVGEQETLRDSLFGAETPEFLASRQALMRSAAQPGPAAASLAPPTAAPSFTPPQAQPGGRETPPWWLYLLPGGPQAFVQQKQVNLQNAR